MALLRSESSPCLFAVDVENSGANHSYQVERHKKQAAQMYDGQNTNRFDLESTSGILSLIERGNRGCHHS